MSHYESDNVWPRRCKATQVSSAIFIEAFIGKNKTGYNQCCQKCWNKSSRSFAKSSPKSTILKNRIKINFKPVFNMFFKVTFLDLILELAPILYNTGLKPVLNQFLTGFWFILKSSPKSSQIAKSPKLNIWLATS